jgi:D-aminopeptidase
MMREVFITVNAMIAAGIMTSVNGHAAEALPHDQLRAVLKKYNRLVESK